jgi:hypothetical protein
LKVIQTKTCLSGFGHKKSQAFAKRRTLFIRNSEPDGNSEANPKKHVSSG